MNRLTSQLIPHLPSRIKEPATPGKERMKAIAGEIPQAAVEQPRVSRTELQQIKKSPLRSRSIVNMILFRGKKLLYLKISCRMPSAIFLPNGIPILRGKL